MAKLNLEIKTNKEFCAEDCPNLRHLQNGQYYCELFIENPDFPHPARQKLARNCKHLMRCEACERLAPLFEEEMCIQRTLNNMNIECSKNDLPELLQWWAREFGPCTSYPKSALVKVLHRAADTIKELQQQNLNRQDASRTTADK